MAVKNTKSNGEQGDRMPRSEEHEEGKGAVRQGGQGAGAAVVPPPETPVAFGPPGREYTLEHERVLGAVAAAQEARQGEGTCLADVVAGSGLPEDRVRELLYELSTVFRLVTRLKETDAPGQEPRYEVKPRL